MLANASAKVAMTATPGTCPGRSVLPRSTSRMASKEWTKVATNRPMASWLGRSRSRRCTMRGETGPIASWTTTRTMVRTSAVRLTIDAATVWRIANTASGVLTMSG